MFGGRGFYILVVSVPPHFSNFHNITYAVISTINKLMYFVTRKYKNPSARREFKLLLHILVPLGTCEAGFVEVSIDPHALLHIIV